MRRILQLLVLLLTLPAFGAPVITNPLVTNMTATTVTIQWTTSDPSSSMVKYGTDPSLPYSTNAVATPVTNHAVILQLLTPGPFYYAAAVSTDNSGTTQSSIITWSMCGSPMTPVAGTATNYYQYGNYTLAWQPPAGYSQAPTVCGQPVLTVFSGSLDGGASFNTNVADASKIVPGPGQWAVTVTDAGGLAPITIYAYLSQTTQNVSQQLQYAARTSGLQNCLTNTITTDSWPPSCGSGGGGGGCGANCALLNAANTFTHNNTFPSLTVNGGINGLPLYENTGLFNIGIGVDSVPPTATGSQNFGLGDQSLQSLTSGYGNGGIGVGALNSLTTGFEFICVGDECGANATTAYKNTGVGASALFYLTTGYDNTAVGAGACSDLVASGDATCIGYLAGSSNHGTYSSLPLGIYIGSGAEPSANGNTNEIVVGANVDGHGSNTTTLGNGSTNSAVIYGVPTFPSLGGSGTGCVAVSNIGLLSVVACGSGGGSSAFQVNGTPLVSTATVNFVNGSNVAITNPSAGNVSFAVTSFPYSGLTGTIPTWNQSTTGNAATATALGVTPSQCSSGSAPTGIAANGNANGCQSISPATGPTLQTNGTNNTSGTLLNFVSTGTIAFTNPSGGIESAAIMSPGTIHCWDSIPGDAYTGFTLGTNLSFSGSVLNASGINGSGTTTFIPIFTGGSTLGNSPLSLTGGILGSSVPVAVTGPGPGELVLTANASSLPGLAANSVAYMGPATGGTSYARQPVNTASSTGGLELWSAPTTISGQNAIISSWFHPEFPVTSGVGAFGGFALYAVLHSVVANNNGHFTSISANTSSAGSGCTTAPTVSVFAGTNTVPSSYYVTASTTQTYQNSPVTVAINVPYTAGQNIGLVLEGAGAGCTTAQFSFSAMTEEP